MKSYKHDIKSIINDLYQAAVISTFAVGYSMFGKKVLKMTPPSIQKFDLNETGKLTLIITTSEMMGEYRISSNRKFYWNTLMSKHSPKNSECCNADRRSFSQCPSLHG